MSRRPDDERPSDGTKPEVEDMWEAEEGVFGG